MSAAYEYFRSRGACQPALEWFAGQSAESAWASCVKGSWMLWVLDHCPSVRVADRKALAEIVATRAISKAKAEDRNSFREAVSDSTKESAIKNQVDQLLASDPLTTDRVVGVAIDSVLKVIHDKPVDGRIIEKIGYTVVQFATREANKQADPKAVATARDFSELELSNLIRGIWNSPPTEVVTSKEIGVLDAI